MALADLSFKLYQDASLTVPFVGLLQVSHKTDLSDNPQDFVLYFGSVVSDRKLEADSNPGVDQITLTPSDLLNNWAASTAYSLGAYIEPTTPNGLKYVCTTAGTSSGAEPAWPTSGIGSTVADGSVIWTLLGDRHETTEIKLATTNAGLDSATAGAPLNIGTIVNTGTANKVEIHIRITNAVTTVNDNSGHPEIGVNINAVVEREV